MMDGHSGRRPDAGAVTTALVRSAVSTLGLLAAYFLLPMADWRGGRLWWLALGLVLLALLCGRQVRAIVRSRHPLLRAVEALSVSAPLYVLLFATGYFLMGAANPRAFTEPLSRVDALYFAVTVLTTTGFGDIAAVSAPARIVVTVQLVGGVGFVAVVGRVFVAAVRGDVHPRR